MTSIILGLLAAVSVTHAEAKGETKKYHLRSIRSNFRCAQARTPASACTPLVKRVPEEVVLKVTTDRAGKHLQLESPCRTMKGDLRQVASDTKVKVQSNRDRCAGRELSLEHEAVFQYVQNVKGFVEEGPTQTTALVNDQISLILEPME